jgi:hypothetical protein
VVKGGYWESLSLGRIRLMNEIYYSLFFNEADALSKFPLELWSAPPVGWPRETF